MLLPELTYHRADSVRDALRLLSEHPGARPLAGGQTLVNAMKLRLVAPPALVDISALDELRTVEQADGSLRIGAGVTYAQLERSAAVRAAHPVVAEVAAGTVDRQVRNRGTIGGNVCLADPTSNFPPLLVALGARMHVAGRRGDRVVDAAEFFTGPLQVAVGRDELLTAVELPPLPPGTGVAYRTLQKAPDSWALARAVAWLRVTGGTVDEARVVLGCVAPVPVRATAMERALTGSPATAATVERAGVLAVEDVDPPSDVHASAEYRRAMAGVYARRATLAALPEGKDDDV